MIKIKEKGKDYGLYASTSFKKGDVVYVMEGKVFGERFRETVEIKYKNIKLHMWDRLFQFSNHSFDPSVEINKQTYVVTALKDIAEGDEITFNYTTHESDIVHPFTDDETGFDVGDTGRNEG